MVIAEYTYDDERRTPAIRTAALAAYGIARTGAVLVRPDGYVAWRSQREPREDAALLENALRRVLGN